MRVDEGVIKQIVRAHIDATLPERAVTLGSDLGSGDPFLLAEKLVANSETSSRHARPHKGPSEPPTRLRPEL